MLGRERGGLLVPSVVGADDGSEKRVELADGEKWSMDETDELESRDRRGWGCE